MSFRLLDLPLELRESVYNFYFQDSSNGGDNLELLQFPGPNNALRRTCKAIRDETHKIYRKAGAAYEARRTDLLYQLGCKSQMVVGRNLSRQATALRNSSVLLMGRTNPWCLHPCTEKGRGCYRCGHRAHLDCFRCGKWLALAVYYTFHSHEVPALVEADGSGDLTPLGRQVELRFRHLWLVPSGVWRHGGCYGQDWWRLELERQKVLDRRCRIRDQAMVLWEKQDDVESCSIGKGFLDDWESRYFKTELAEIERFTVDYYEVSLDWQKEWQRRSSSMPTFCSLEVQGPLSTTDCPIGNAIRA